ncbi:uncharacterized protein LOC124147603 isoform X2 [Haliotis rufescens]|uniref:uncharacterized protein LOC124147603 isoform X2 n=1 Tax=Haliotis rufescens TaxID=6454 RepID=UPI00201F3339|nr:uncharacterized protein LOC124147603 isoform X2 [Haliotis rufescens]
MKFHHVHGKAIVLSDDRKQATRSEAHFCNGLVFGDQAIKVGQKLCVELTCVSSWSGALRIGVTTNDPNKLTQADLPKFAFPDLLKKEGYWGRSVNENLTASGTRVTFYVTTEGHLQVFINNEHKGVYLSRLPTNRTLWLFLDIYGNTKATKFVTPDDAPKEIVARGPEAMEAYEKACSTGTQPVFRTRLMLVGKDRVGKTSLKKALTGQSHNTAEESTDGIDLSASCSFNLNNRSSWQLAIKGEQPPEAESDDEKKNLGILGGSEGLEEEYHKALATNIVQELLYQKRQKEAVTKTSRDIKSAVTSHSAGKITNRITDKRKPLLVRRATSLGMNLFDDIKEVPPEVMQDVPDRVVQLVQQMLGQGSQGSPTHSLELVQTAEKSHQVVLNIWDFAGQAVYYTTHQVFLTARAIYVIVFNLCDDLTGKQLPEMQEKDEAEDSLSTLDYMDFWLRSIHAHAAENMRNSVDNTKLSPPIFIVGTHRDSLALDHDAQMELVADKFNQLREFLTGQPYTQHIVTPFFAVENNSLGGEDVQIDKLRQHIERIASQESYMGEQMPIKWLKFEQDVTERADTGTHYATVDQITEMASNHGITDTEEVTTLLEFYHDLGVIIHYGSAGPAHNVLRNTVILKPQWLVDMFRRIITARSTHDQWDLLSDKWDRLEKLGILEEPLLDMLWSDALDQKPTLLALMDKFDLICRRLPPRGQTHREETHSYYVPMRLEKLDDQRHLYTLSDNVAVFYLDFNNFLPDGLFYRILTRAIRWSQDSGGRDPYLYSRIAKFFLDDSHDFVLELSPRAYHRLKVVVVGISDSIYTNPGYNPLSAACAKVRNFLESTLTDLRQLWMKRIACKMCLRCTCDKVCERHGLAGCTQEACLHFLDLDECLTSKIVCCEHRRVKTADVRKWFPQPKIDMPDPILPRLTLEITGGNIEKNVPNLPSWMKGAAKLLNSGADDQDWAALAKLMGYKQARIDQINEDLNPALALLTDWVLTSGNTSLSVDLMMVFLEQIKRDDIVDVIQKAKESESDLPQIFLSYQWDSQDDVQSLRARLERAGFTCWMDIGQMGGGDQLNLKIDEGIRNCVLFVSCITPKYVVSHHCNRELALADILKKPIIPVMFESVVWPPPGGMSVILSQLVYINMKGVGGHGGSGVHADLQDKHNEIINRILLYTMPAVQPCIDSAVTVTDISKQQDLGSESLYDTSLSSLTEPDIPLLQEVYHAPPSPHRNPVVAPQPEPAQRAAAAAAAAATRNVEQVHVTKCAVCVIL